MRTAKLGITTFSIALACLGSACTDDGGGDEEASGSTSESGSSTSESGSTGESGTGETGTGETSAGETSAGETSAGETSAGETSAGETSAGETSAGETSGETGGFGSCAEIEAAYAGEVSLTQCSGDEDCKIVLGHCGVGLGGCDYAVNVEVSETLLDQLADAYVAANCTQGVCDCAPPPAMAVCVEGTCVGQG
jgi:hypothetical protein